MDIVTIMPVLIDMMLSALPRKALTPRYPLQPNHMVHNQYRGPGLLLLHHIVLDGTHTHPKAPGGAQSMGRPSATTRTMRSRKAVE